MGEFGLRRCRVMWSLRHQPVAETTVYTGVVHDVIISERKEQNGRSLLVCKILEASKSNFFKLKKIEKGKRM